MTKQIFLEELRKALSGRVSSSVVNENISYYEEYISTQVRAGRNEAQIIEELGDPRILARSLADAEKRAGAFVEESVDGVRGESDHPMRRIYELPGWLILVGVILIVLVVLGVVFKVIGFFMPVLIPIAVVVFFLKLLQRK